MSTPSADTLSAYLSNLDISKPLPSSFSELRPVLESFSDPTLSKKELGVAYAYLARLLLSPPSSTPAQNETRDDHLRKIARVVAEWLSDTTPLELGKAFGALGALVQIDVDSFSRIIALEGIDANLADAAETITGDFKIANEEEVRDARRSFVLFVSHAAGYSKTRVLAKDIASVNRNWLLRRLNDAEEDEVIRAAAAVACVKLSVQDISTQQTGTNGVRANVGNKLDLPTRSDLLNYLMNTYTGRTQPNSFSISLALEGLALLSLRPSVRRVLVKESSFVQRLLDPAQLQQRNDLAFSIASLLSHLLAYHRSTGEEDRAKEKLRKYASKGSCSVEEQEEEKEGDEEISTRNEQLLKAGIMPVVVILAKHSSPPVRQIVGTILLALVDANTGRPTIIQQGGARALLTIIANTKFPATSRSASSDDFVAIQAFAKLLITSNPAMILGTGAGLVDASIPLTLPVLHPSANLLQQFECLMALTNLAGLSEEVREKIAKKEGFLGRIEDIILDGNNTMVVDSTDRETEAEGSIQAEEVVLDGKAMCRRAATELICNIVSCETAFIRYTAFDQVEELKSGKLPAAVASRLHLIVALADSTDLKTRSAAFGALTNLTLAPTAAAFIASDAKRLSIIVSGSTEPNDLVCSASIMCLRNMAFAQVSAAPQLVSILSRLAEDGSERAQADAAEALRDLSEQ